MPCCQLNRNYSPKTESPPRTGDRRTDFNIDEFARQTYRQVAKDATEALMTFITKLNPDPNNPVLCITYFDEASELDQLLWVLIRLVGNQDSSTAMWYVFMATKSKIAFFFPDRGDSEYLVYSRPPMTHREIVSSLRLFEELKRPVAPYLALGFDQIARANQGEMSVTMGEFQTIEHCCKYGRPLYVISRSVENVPHDISDGMPSTHMKKTKYLLRPNTS